MSKHSSCRLQRRVLDVVRVIHQAAVIQVVVRPLRIRMAKGAMVVVPQEFLATKNGVAAIQCG